MLILAGPGQRDLGREGRLQVSSPLPRRQAARSEATVGRLRGRWQDGQNPAVRLCVRCKQLKPAVAFPSGRRVCTTCQSAREPHRRRRGNTQRVVEATRARGRALRRLALEFPVGWTVGEAGAVASGRQRQGDLADQHRGRFAVLYRQELQRARSEHGPIRQGHPPPRRVLRPRPRTGSAPASLARPSGARGRAVRGRPLGVLGRPVPRHRPPDCGQLARRRRGDVEVPEGPRASDPRPLAAADRAGAAAGASRPRLRR